MNIVAYSKINFLNDVLSEAYNISMLYTVTNSACFDRLLLRYFTNSIRIYIGVHGFMSCAL